MTREEIIQILHQANVAAELTVLPSEMALECTYITPKGYKYEWMALDHWPAYIISFCNQEDFQSIKEKILNRNFGFPDLRETVLYSLYTALVDGNPPTPTVESLCKLFNNLTKLDYPDEGRIYVLYSAGIVEFFPDYKLFEAAFAKSYATDVISWENLSDEELKEWLDRTKCEFDRIPCLELDE